MTGQPPQPLPPPPPGWYPQQGGMQWWDGRQWVGPIQPAASTHGAGETPSIPAQERRDAKAQRPWFKKKRFILPLGLLALFIAIPALGFSGSGDTAATPAAAAETTGAVPTPDEETTSAAPTPDEQTTSAAPAEVTESEEPDVEEVEEPAETVSQEQARLKAADYLDYTSFSREGLIQQLKFEGFSTKDATYGADAVDANWNKQAALKAKEYLDYTSFSRQSLIDQLMFDGFTAKQATYGVDQTGL